MYKILNGAVLALAVAGAMFTVAKTANAETVGISLNVGDVAFGYNDGYWDKSHKWHEWKQRSDMESYKAAAGNQYHDWKHDRDADKGWHESDRK